MGVIFIQEQPFEEGNVVEGAVERARHRRLFRGEKRETVKSSVGNAGFYTTRFGKRSVGPMAAFLNQERPEDYQLPDRFGPGLGFDENTAEFGGYLTKEVPKECFYSKLMGGLVCSYSD